jgi:hypothetical protein
MTQSPATELDARAAWTIATAMREVANADGEHPNELALITAFEMELPPGASDGVDLDALDTAEAKEVFLKSLVLVALADGRMSEEEVLIIRGYSSQLGLDEAALTDVIQQVSVMMLGQFAGVTHFRDQANAIGRALGLDEDTIDRVLTNSG